MANDGIAQYRIEKPADATVAEEFASSELADFLQQITGGDFLSGKQKSTIILAYNSEFKQEEWKIETKDGNIYISGGRPRGILFGVYDFLETYANCRWFAPDASRIPQNKNLKISDSISRHKNPAFFKRDIYDPHFRDKEQTDLYQLWQIRCKTIPYPYQEKYGFGIVIGSPRGGHSIYSYAIGLPKDKPEYLTLNANGKRVVPTSPAGEGNVCYSHPEVRKNFTEQLRNFIIADRKKAKGQDIKIPEIYDISVNDNSDNCYCAQCKKLTAQYGSSGLFADFINTITKPVVDEFPDIKITTLAYGSVLEPPKKIKFNDYIYVRLAQLGSEVRNAKTSRDTMRSVTHPNNRASLEALREWSKAATMASWDYWVIYEKSSSPYTNINAIASTLQEYQSCKVKYIFAEAECYANDYFGISFHDLRDYVASVLMVEPERNVRELISDFMNGYYGAAAEPMQKYFDYLEKRMSETKERQMLLHVNHRPYLDNEFFQKTEQFFADAEKLAGDNKEIHNRIALERIPVDWIAFCKYDSIDKQNYSVSRDDLSKRILKNSEIMQKRYNSAQSDKHLKNIEAALKNMLIRIPLPTQFEGKRVYDYYWFSETPFSVHEYNHVLADSDAATGFAVQINNKNKADKFHNGTLSFGVYDAESKQNLLRKIISAKDIVQDEKYHWYYVGRTRLGNSTRFWGHWSWHFNKMLNEAINPAYPQAYYDIYVSAKVQGPSYVKGSKLPDAVRFERIVVEYIGD